jgi:ornithine cyclodeaminase/alanine dehydrogenase-like protein (mu-crystallin family)
MFDAPLYLNEDQVARVLSEEVIYQTVASTLRALAAGRVLNGAKGNLSIDDAQGRRYMGAISGALLDQAVAGVKWFATCEGNRARGLPRVPATILVNDSVTGILQGVVEAGALTARRTAALAAVSVANCQAAGSRKAAIVGFGAIGQALPHYLATRTGVGTIAVHGRNFEKTKADCARIGRGLAVPIAAEPALQVALRDADIIITASGLKEDAPFLQGSWLKPGATVCALGSYQEIDATVVQRAGRIIVDNWEVCQHRGRGRRTAGPTVAG